MVDLTDEASRPRVESGQQPGAARKEQFIRVLGDGGDSQTAALK